MTTQQFRKIIMVISLIAILELVIGVFYYFVFFSPKKQMESLRVQEQTAQTAKQLEQDRLLKEAELREKTRMEEISLEVKRIDLEMERIKRWEESGDEFEKLRAEEERNRGKEASLASCMKIVVENYHNQWNLYCTKLGLPNSCSLPSNYTEEINSDYLTGKEQCDNFFK
jgi:hypothetical protein